ncbi:MAG: hypothetical protein ACI8YQ_004287 [Polaribacter sp.]
MYNKENTVLGIRYLRVFNRWGALVFENIDFHLDDEAHGWDGYFKGVKLNPGVLVYLAEVEWIDGRVELLKGDVTLMK